MDGVATNLRIGNFQIGPSFPNRSNSAWTIRNRIKSLQSPVINSYNLQEHQPLQMDYASDLQFRYKLQCKDIITLTMSRMTVLRERGCSSCDWSLYMWSTSSRPPAVFCCCCRMSTVGLSTVALLVASSELSECDASSDMWLSCVGLTLSCADGFALLYTRIHMRTTKHQSVNYSIKVMTTSELPQSSSIGIWLFVFFTAYSSLEHICAHKVLHANNLN